MADPRYYLAVAAVYAISFFLPDIILMRMESAFRLTPGSLKASFKYYERYRVGLTLIGMFASFIAPAVFGIHPLVPLVAFAFWLAILIGDMVQAYRIAKDLKESADAADGA